MPDFKVIGKAVALKRGHYPKPEGGSRIIPEGQTFEVFEGLTKSTWFRMLDAPKPVTEAAPVKGKPGPKPRPAAEDDIA